MRSQYGFTLIEMMVTISIATILLALGVPSFQLVVANNRMSSITNEMLATLAYGRSEAMMRGATIAVCRSGDITAAINSLACTAGTNWSTGWIVFVDDNQNGARDATEPVLRVSQAIPAGYSVSTAAGNAKSIQINQRGQISGVDGSSAVTSGANLLFTLCKGTGSGKTITITPTGKASSGATTC